jgi:hypothetical protein
VPLSLEEDCEPQSNSPTREDTNELDFELEAVQLDSVAKTEDTPADVQESVPVLLEEDCEPESTSPTCEDTNELDLELKAVQLESVAKTEESLAEVQESVPLSLGEDSEPESTDPTFPDSLLNDGVSSSIQFTAQRTQTHPKLKETETPHEIVLSQTGNADEIGPSSTSNLCLGSMSTDSTAIPIAGFFHFAGEEESEEYSDVVGLDVPGYIATSETDTGPRSLDLQEDFEADDC